jgi:Kyakuja-Dileera-Zisupton transposase
MDANFRLKRLNMSTHKREPRLNHGFAYVVEETKYKQYLQEYNDKLPDDVSTCNNHDALKSASMRGGKGTAASGVGAVDCIRHDMKRPMSVGDLQTGERYAFFS